MKREDSTLMTLWATLIFSIYAFHQQAWAQPQNAEVIDQIRAVVGRKVISDSDLVIQRNIAQKQPSIFPPFEIRRRENMLSFLIDIEMMNQLASEVPLYKPNPEQFQLRYEELKPLLQPLSHILDENKLKLNLYMLMTAENFANRSMGTKENYIDWIQTLRERVPYRIIEN